MCLVELYFSKKLYNKMIHIKGVTPSSVRRYYTGDAQFTSESSSTYEAREIFVKDKDKQWLYCLSLKGEKVVKILLKMPLLLSVKALRSLICHLESTTIELIY